MSIDEGGIELPHRMIAREQRESDPFADAVIRSIPREERDSFSDRQIEALSKALTRTRLVSQHLVDARITIPVFFARFYAVFLFGRDKTMATRTRLIERRRKGSLIAGLLLAGSVAVLISLFLLAILFGIVYLLKTALGIDIFPDSHLWDLLTG